MQTSKRHNVRYLSSDERETVRMGRLAYQCLKPLKRPTGTVVTTRKSMTSLHKLQRVIKSYGATLQINKEKNKPQTHYGNLYLNGNPNDKYAVWDLNDARYFWEIFKHFSVTHVRS